MALQYEQLKQDLVTEFGLGVLAPQKQEELVLGMTEVLMKRIFVETMEKLGDAGIVEYEKFLEQKPDESQIETFLQEKIPGYNDVIVQLVKDFKAEMKGEKS